MAETFDYEKSSMARIYDEARSLPAETLELWLDEIAAVAPRDVRVILDLGCGTGRFTAALARRLTAEVIGADPSRRLLAAARARDAGVVGVTYQLGTAEAIPIAEPVDMIFMSMVYHHLSDRKQAIKEMARVLAAGGRLIVRNSTREDIDDNALFAFFPEAAALERRRMPTERQLVDEIEAGPFCLVRSRTVEQVFARTYLEYYEKVSKRGLSALQMISDDDFHAGLEELRRFCEAQQGSGHVLERVHLLAFERTSEAGPRG